MSCNQSTLSDTWNCPCCTLVNAVSKLQCKACGYQLQASYSDSENDLNKSVVNSFNTGQILCHKCTFSNSKNSKLCKICGASFTKNTPKTVTITIDESDDSSSSESTDNYYKIAESVVVDCVIETPLNESLKGCSYQCIFDGRSFRTKAMMTAYLVKNCKTQLIAISNEHKYLAEENIVPRNQLASKGSPEVCNRESKRGVTDEEIALQLALNEYDEMVVTQSSSKSSLKHSRSRVKRIKESSDSLLSINSHRHRSKAVGAVKSSDVNTLKWTGTTNAEFTDDFLSLKFDKKELSDLDQELSTHESDAAYRELRLNKLLIQTDKITRKISSMMVNLVPPRVSNLDLNLEISKNSGDTNRIDSPSSITLTSQPSLLRNVQLRDYQLRGVEWLTSLHTNGLGGILAGIFLIHFIASISAGEMYIYLSY